MKWLFGVLAFIFVAQNVSGDVCSDYATYLVQVEADLAKTYADLLKVEAEIADQQDAIDAATVDLQAKQAEYTRLRGLFYVDPEILAAALEDVKTAQNFLDTLKNIMKDLQAERDALSAKMLGLADVRVFLENYLATHCVPNPNPNPAPDPNFP
jgi:multidrug resistance efflux pump